MNSSAKVTNIIKAARQHPGYIVLGLVGLFFLNLSFLVYLVINLSNNGIFLLTVFSMQFVWPISLVVFGIIRLRRGKSTDEMEIKRRREVTLRYFALGILFLLILLIVSWRYYSVEDYFYVRYYSIPLIVTIIIFSGFLVIVSWYWIQNSQNKLSAYINKAPRLYLISIIIFVTALICYVASSDIRNILTDSSLLKDVPRSYVLEFQHTLSNINVVFQSFTWIGGFAAIGAALLGYLRPSEPEIAVRPQVNNEEKLDQFAVRTETPTGNERAESTSIIIKSDDLAQLISTVTLNNNRIEKLLNQSALSSYSLITREVLAEKVGIIRGRLTSELKELAKRGNLNLTIGILTTIGAASALFWGLIATQPAPNETGTADILRHYLPRISFAIFIEVFSFFFLRLYKNSLEDIKYYHNELTSLDSKLLALEIAATAQVSEALTPILLGLLNTDRNFILKSGESTVELEKVKTEQQYMRTLIDTISSKIPALGIVKESNNKS